MAPLGSRWSDPVLFAAGVLDAHSMQRIAAGAIAAALQAVVIPGCKIGTLAANGHLFDRRRHRQSEDGVGLP